jgi:hypothetical protein
VRDVKGCEGRGTEERKMGKGGKACVSVLCGAPASHRHSNLPSAGFSPHSNIHQIPAIKASATYHLPYCLALCCALY